MQGLATALDPVVFTQDTADKAAVVSSVLGGGGYMQKDTDDVPTPKQYNKKAASPKTTTIGNFSADLAISRTFMADQQFSAVARSVRQATQQWQATRDRNAFGVFAGGFATTDARCVTVDAVALFSNSHVNQNGDTVDNLETGALSNDNLNVVVDSLRTQVDNSGVIVGYEPKFLLVPSILHQQGVQIAKSVLRAGTGNNDLNYWSEMYPGMKVVYSPHLNSTSTTAYMVGTSNHNVFRFERESFFTDLVDWRTQRDDQYIYKMRAREEADAVNYVGLVGSNGTT